MGALILNNWFDTAGGYATYGRVEYNSPVAGYARVKAGAEIRQYIRIPNDVSLGYINLHVYTVYPRSASFTVSINGQVINAAARNSSPFDIVPYKGQTILLSLKANSDGDFGYLNTLHISATNDYISPFVIPMTAPLSFQFEDRSSGNARGDSHSWNFGDGTTGSGITTSHTYAEPGEYVVTMTSSKGSFSLLVNAEINPPDASFTPSLQTTKPNTSISFSNTSWRSVSYLWDFGDGTTSTETSPSHSYASKGTYTVTLTAISDLGQSTKTETIVIVAVPIPNFSASPVQGLTVQFSDLSLEDPTSWSWDFGENEKTLQNPVHSYQQPGTYNVTLTATNAMGSQPITKSVPVVVSEPVRPEANFSYQPTESNKTQIEFTDTSSNCPSSWLWSFGDGTTSTEQNPVHQYSTGGIYSVRLTVTNANGDATVSKTISVITPGTTPPTSGTVTPSTAQVGKMVEFTVTGTGFKPNVRIRIVHNSFRGVVSKFKSFSSSRIVFSYAFDPWFVGVNSITISNPDGSSVVIPDCITVTE